MGEFLPNTGNAPGFSTRRMLVCQLLVHRPPKGDPKSDSDNDRQSRQGEASGSESEEEDEEKL